MESQVVLPLDYGSTTVSAGDLCGGVHLDEFSSVQYLTFSAESSLVSGGSYQLMLDKQSTSCLPFDASETQLKAAIQDLDSVGDIDITAKLSGGAYEYTIIFQNYLL